MSASFLNLTNVLLRELNEVALTSASFAGAIGVQAHVKDCVNRAYLDIINEEPKWPFLAVSTSGNPDPFYGNVTTTTSKGTRWYLLKEGSVSHRTDYNIVDWDSFYLTTIGVDGATAPYVSKNLKYTTNEEWKDFYRTSENEDDAGTQRHGEPARVIRSADGRSFGLSPIPDKAYKVYFFAYVQPTELVNYSDEIVFKDVYKNVLLARARYYMHQFKQETQAAAFALDEYNKGIRAMKNNLLHASPDYMKDDRVRYV